MVRRNTFFIRPIKMDLGCIFPLVCAILASAYGNEEKRPLFIVGQMANSLQDVDEFVQLGANVIEADLRFDKHSGQATYVYEGFPCDCFRICHKSEDALKFMQHISDISTPGNSKFQPSFTGVLWLDAHLSSTTRIESAGQDMARLLDVYLLKENNNAKVVFDISSLSEWPFIISLVGHIRERDREDALHRIGVSASSGENFEEFISRAKYLGIGIWLGDGGTNCFEHFFSLSEVKRACRLRDSGSDVGKVVRWTVDTRTNMRNSMRLGVDVIGTNDVHDVLAVMEEDEFQNKYRSATANDNPFSKV